MLERAQDARSNDRPGSGRCASQAIGAFRRTGFPTTRDEEWRFTSVAPIADTPFAAGRRRRTVPGSDVAPFLVPGLDGPALVFVNGRFAPRLSTLDARGARGDRARRWPRAGERPAAARAAPRPPRGRRRPRVHGAEHRVRSRTARSSRCPTARWSSRPIQVLFVSTLTPQRRPCRTRGCSSCSAATARRASSRSSRASAPSLGFTNAVTEFVVGRGRRPRPLPAPARVARRPSTSGTTHVRHRPIRPVSRRTR